MYRKTSLKNGLRVITYHMPGMRSASLGIWIRTGGRFETHENSGISHYLEHMLFKGSRTYSCRQIKESIEGVGGSLNGFTSEELTCYLVKIPAQSLGLAFDILSDMVINPMVPASEVEKERTVILEEIKMYKDLPQSYVHELLDNMMWPDQPLGKPIIGTEETVGKFNRSDITGYKNSYYTPANIVVSAAGALDHGTLTGMIERAFGRMKASTPNEYIKVRENQHSPEVFVHNKNTEQTHLALGFHGFKRGHRLQHAQNILHIILGANMSSRLFNEVREKRGLAYEIGSQVKFFADTGAFIVHAGIDNRKVDAALGIIFKELKKIRAVSVGAKELRRAKDFYIGQLVLALEDTMDNMLWIGESTASLDKTFTPDEIIEKVRALKPSDIHEACENIFNNEKINCALIGPHDKAQERFLRILDLS